MTSNKKRRSGVFKAAIVAALAFFIPVLSWSEARVVKAGDEATVGFVCRLKSGELAAASYKAWAGDLVSRRSVIFQQRPIDTPITVIAGEASGATGRAEERGLEAEILYRMATLIVGMPVGERQMKEVIAERRPETKKNEYILQMARVRQRAKEMHLTPGQYQAMARKPPEVGGALTLDPATPGKVVSVTENEVVVRFFAEAGAKVRTPLGEGTVRELADRYEIVIDPHPGTLVRSGALVGRIVSVDGDFINVDYGHAFGGESLLCDITVESVKQAVK